MRDAAVTRNEAITSAPIYDELLHNLDAYWRADNFLSVGQIYLCDNPLLKEPLSPGNIKRMLLGHWGTTPGQNFIYTNRKSVDIHRIHACHRGTRGVRSTFAVIPGCRP